MMKLLQGFWRFLGWLRGEKEESRSKPLLVREKPPSKRVKTKKAREDSKLPSKQKKAADKESKRKDKESLPRRISAPKCKSSKGSKTQVNRNKSGAIIRRKKQRVYLQIGLDFGTSATKVIYTQLGKRISRAICFDHNLPTYPDYCLPSLAAIDSQGNLLLGIEAARFLSRKNWDTGFQRFKVAVAGKHDRTFYDELTHENFNRYRRKHSLDSDFTPERLTAIYLAYAMHESRERISKLPEYGDTDIEMAFNICVPIDHIENNKVREAFERIFTWAEAIEKYWYEKQEQIDLLRASFEFQDTRISKGDRRVFAVPEAVATMASYLVSLHKKPGLHAMIDIGAGTTDISICNLQLPSGQSKSYWYAAKNISRGTINIERKIASLIKKHKRNSLCTHQEIYQCLYKLNPNQSESRRLPVKDADIKSVVVEALEDLRNSEEYYKTWGCAYNHLRKQTEWEKVEIFVCGGGASLPGIKDVFARPWWKNLEVRYSVSKLPTPDDYDSGDGVAPFTRMAVAYGLSKPLPELEEYILPSDVGDHTPAPLPYLKLDHEEIYPK